MDNTKVAQQQKQEQEQTKETLPVDSQFDESQELSDEELASIAGGVLHLAAGGSIGI
jgi:bacteriocin-like protein